MEHRFILYSPLPSQRKFHQLQSRFKGFSGPVGSGKSQALCHEAIRLSYLNPGRHGLIGAPTYPMLRDATLRGFLDILESNRLPFDFHKSESTVTMKDTDSKVLFRAVDDFERLRGTNLAWFGVDELTYTSQEVWLRLEGRLRDPKASQLCGFAVWTPKGYDWVYKRFIRDRVSGYDVIVAEAYENRYLLDKVPDYYERLKASYDVRFFGQEVLGQYLSVNSTAVYHAFDRKRNVAEVRIDPSRPLLWALDFNVNPMCSVIAQRTGDELNILDEIVLRKATTMDAAAEFQRRFPRHTAGVFVYGDASGAKAQTTGLSDYRIIRDGLQRAGYGTASFRVPSSNPPVRERLLLVNSKLCSTSGESALRIHPSCTELIADLEEVSYKADTTSVDKDRDPSRTHLSDALGYLLWQEFRPGPKFGDQPNRLFW